MYRKFFHSKTTFGEAIPAGEQSAAAEAETACPALWGIDPKYIFSFYSIACPPLAGFFTYLSGFDGLKRLCGVPLS